MKRTKRAEQKQQIKLFSHVLSKKGNKAKGEGRVLFTQHKMLVDHHGAMERISGSMEPPMGFRFRRILDHVNILMGFIRSSRARYLLSAFKLCCPSSRDMLSILS